MYGGKLVRCNDVKVTDKQRNCTGLYMRHLYVRKHILEKRNARAPIMWCCAYGTTNPYNFNFHTIGSSVLPLFEVLSLKSWLEVQDFIIDRIGSVSRVISLNYFFLIFNINLFLFIFVHYQLHAIFVDLFVFIGTLFGLSIFVGIVITINKEIKVNRMQLI
jgi:hypothetical protein